MVASAVTDLNHGPTVRRGHDIALQVNIDSARMEDFLSLPSSSGTPLLTGDLTLKSTLRYFARPGAGAQALEAQGRFQPGRGAIYEREDSGQDRTTKPARPGTAEGVEGCRSRSDVRSPMQGKFKMAGGVITLPDAEVHSARSQIDVKGTYGIDGGALDFTGTAKTAGHHFADGGRVEGHASEAGRPHFRERWRGHGGSRSTSMARVKTPHFGVDFSRLKNAAPETPGKRSEGSSAGQGCNWLQVPGQSDRA